MTDDPTLTWKTLDMDGTRFAEATPAVRRAVAATEVRSMHEPWDETVRRVLDHGLDPVEIRDTLIAHTRLTDDGLCSCGWQGTLGRRFTDHQAAMLRVAIITGADQ